MNTPLKVALALRILNREDYDNAQWTMYLEEHESGDLYGTRENVTLQPHLAVWSAHVHTDMIMPPADIVLHAEYEDKILIYNL